MGVRFRFGVGDGAGSSRVSERGGLRNRGRGKGRAGSRFSCMRPICPQLTGALLGLQSSTKNRLPPSVSAAWDGAACPPGVALSPWGWVQCPGSLTLAPPWRPSSLDGSDRTTAVVLLGAFVSSVPRYPTVPFLL